MTHNRPDNPDDRRDPIREGSSLSGSTERDNAATEKALHPGQRQDQSVSSESHKESRSPEGDAQDQDPGQRQKQNQADKKEDDLAA
ncbi:MAG TPA: hypothetical protein VN577_20745 [Terriglobales bacterium]|nr:hypothetical protein [Terriglobales bacterium]